MSVDPTTPSSEPSADRLTNPTSTADSDEDDGENVVNVIKDFAKKAAIITGIYLVGYFGFSVSWLYCVFIIASINYRLTTKKRERWTIARAMALGYEKDILLKKLHHLPSWVNFPDIERVEWLNKIIKQTWPRVNHYARDLLPNVVEPIVQSYTKGFKFDSVILGQVPFRIDGVKVYDEDTSRNKIIMDLDISYAGDCRITFQLTGMKGGIENFQLRGRLRVIMKPLISSIPLIGGLQVYFMQEPEVDFDLVGVAQILSMPGLRTVLQKSVLEALNSMLLFPNIYSIKLSDDVGTAELKTFEPEGILRVNVISAKHLMKKDIGLMGSGKSDPYTVLWIGPKKFKTPTIDNTVDPDWNFWCEFQVESTNSELGIHVWDHDDGSKDETLGHAVVSVRNIVRKGQDDMWIPLQGVMHGMIHINLTWLSLSSNGSDLDAALQETRMLNANVSSALLIVYVDSAKNLQQPKASHLPDPFVTMSVENQTQETCVAWLTCDPIWEQGFTFLVYDPLTANLNLRIRDKKSERAMGECSYQVSQILDAPELEVHSQPLLLSKTGPEATILCSMKLKVFKNESSEEPPPSSPREKKFSETKNEEYREPTTPTSKSQPKLIKQESLMSSVNCDSPEPTDDEGDSTETENIETTLSPRNSLSSLNGESNNGSIKLTLRYSMQREKLRIVVHEVSNIPLKHHSTFPDPYVKLYLLPKKSKDSKRKTQVVKDNCHPVFDETFEYLLAWTDLNSMQLEVTVATEKKALNFGKNILGQVIIDLGKYNLTQTYSAWFELRPEK